MKNNWYITPIAMGVGIGAAMSVALHDNAVGWAIGFGVAVAFTLMRRKDKPEDN